MFPSKSYPLGSRATFYSKFVEGILKFYRRSDGVEFYAIDGANKLAFGPEFARHIRSRFTIAQVNAGADLLPAIPGYKYRMLECSAIAVGGAVAAVTTVDVKAGATVLVAFTQAALLQSVEVRAGDTGGGILADGASYVQNAANTKITVIKAGADITTATHVDILFTYELAA